MGTHTGSEGSVKISTNIIAEVRSWTIEESADSAEDTTMGDQWRTHKTTLKSWSGSLECFWDETDTTGQGALVLGAEVALKVYPEGASTGDKFFEGSALVQGISRTASFDGLVEASFTFKGNGALTESTAS